MSNSKGMITKEQANQLIERINEYAEHYYYARNGYERPGMPIEEVGESLVKFIESFIEQEPAEYVVRIGEHYLHYESDCDGGYLGDLEKAGRFPTVALAESGLRGMPHKENREAAEIVLLSEARK